MAQKLVYAEIQNLEQDGDQHPGFSSLYGRLNGIWRNKQALAAVPEYLADMGGPED